MKLFEFDSIYCEVKMKLEEFVTEAINEIISGISNSQTFAKTKNAIVNPSLKKTKKTLSTGEKETIKRPPGHIVEFDIAVTTTQGKGTQGGLGVFVGSIGAGTKGHSESSNSTVSRIKFTVPVVFPIQDE